MKRGITAEEFMSGLVSGLNMVLALQMVTWIQVALKLHLHPLWHVTWIYLYQQMMFVQCVSPPGWCRGGDGMFYFLLNVRYIYRNGRGFLSVANRWRDTTRQEEDISKTTFWGGTLRVGKLPHEVTSPGHRDKPGGTWPQPTPPWIYLLFSETLDSVLPSSGCVA